MTEKTETRGLPKKMKFHSKDLQVRCFVKEPGSTVQYMMQFRVLNAKGAGSPTDFNIISMSQLFYNALKAKFGGHVRYGGKGDLP